MAHEKDAADGSMKPCGGLVLAPAIISPPIPALKPPASPSFRPSARPSRFGSSYRNLRGAFRKTRMDMKKVKRNLRRKGENEFDLVAVDGGRVLVVEVKNKLEKRMVDRFVEKKLPRFKEMFPEYEKYQVVGGMGALVVNDDVGRYAEKAGLYVLTQTDEGGAAPLNWEGFEPRTFE